MSGISGIGTAVSYYVKDSADETELASQYAASDTTTKAAIAELKSSADTLTSAKALMKNYSDLKTVLTSFGMEGDITYTALLNQLMTQDPTSSSSTAKKSSNSTWIAFADAMDGYTTNPFTDSSTLNEVIKAYSINSYEQSRDSLAPGLSTALAFKRTAASITSVNSLMLNTDALKVAVQKTGLTYLQFAEMDYSEQVSLLNKDITLSDFQDSKKVDQMAERYLLSAGSSPSDWGAATTTSYSVTSLFGADAATSVLDLFGASSSSSSSSSSVLNLFS